MLVLSRRIGERVFIGEDIVITIVDINNGKVRIGITAPSSVTILREELKPRGESDNKPKKT